MTLPGCSVGVLTAKLAARVNHLVASDIADTAVARARERCRGLAHIQIHQHDVEKDPLDGPFGSDRVQRAGLLLFGRPGPGDARFKQGVPAERWLRALGDPTARLRKAFSTRFGGLRSVQPQYGTRILAVLSLISVPSRGAN